MNENYVSVSHFGMWKVKPLPEPSVRVFDPKWYHSYKQQELMQRKLEEEYGQP